MKEQKSKRAIGGEEAEEETKLRIEELDLIRYITAHF